MLRTNLRINRLFAVSIAAIIFPAMLVCQSVPVGGNLYGEPITGSCGYGTADNNVFISTSDGIFESEIIRSGDIRESWYYIPIYKGPAGAHIVGISFSTLSKPVYKNIIHVQLSNGTIVNLPLHQVQSNWQVDSIWIGNTPVDSANWKKLTGDAVYALGMPWSSSSPLVFVSRDSLKTWQIDTTGIAGAHTQDFCLDTAQYVYAATDNGLFIQNPDSNVWHKVTSLTQATNLSSVYIDRQNRILVAGSASGLYLSTDNGTSWNTDVSGIGSAAVLLMADDAYHNLYITTGSSFFGPNHVYKSAGGTGPWQISDSSIVRIVGSASFQNMKINSISGDSVLIAGTSFGVFLSTDQGTTWTTNNAGIRAENIAGMAKTSSGRMLLSTALGIFSNTPSDTSWNKIYPQDGFESSLPLYHDSLGTVYTTDPEIVIPSGNGAAAVIKSTDGGTSWSPDTVGLSAATGGRLFYVDEVGGQHSAGYKFPTSNMYVWTKQPGGSWTIDTTGFPIQGSFPISMTSDLKGFLYISGTISSDRVMRRPLGGGAWIADTAGIPQSVSYFGNMAPGINGDVYGVVGYYGPGVMRRSAGTWSNFPLPPSLSSQYVTGLSVDKSGVVFVAFVDYSNAPLGVYFTADGGTSWTHAGLDSVYVTSLVSFGDSTYALSSNSGAFYVGKHPSVTNAVRTARSPQTFVLFQNYPNPFNPTTKISFQLPAVSKTSLKVYDLLGRELATLADGELNPGLHEVTFDASRLASGIYFYRLRAGTFTSTMKLVLLK